ncbi:MAG: tetratricopeptide repeat protein [Myxococcales bacterium]|nr:tetratricopeptide repeat protein [Myxococcota bacterium]MDW8280186.1 tetratricopeptide repeat protein [Myxococcales bacterium]
MRHPLKGSFCLVLALAARPALAQDAQSLPPSKEDLEISRRHYQSGEAFFRAGNYEAARTAFEESYRLSRIPDHLINLAVVARKLGLYEDAIEYLQEYLRLRPECKDRQWVQSQIEKLKADLAEQTSQAPLPNGRQEDETEDTMPPAAPAAPSPPPPAPVAPSTLPAAPEAPSPPVPPWGSLVLGTTGLAALGAGVGLGVTALFTAQEVDSLPRYNRMLDERGRALEIAAITLDVLGSVALVAAGTWALIWHIRGRRGEAGAQPVAHPGRLAAGRAP